MCRNVSVIEHSASRWSVVPHVVEDILEHVTVPIYVSKRHIIIKDTIGVHYYNSEKNSGWHRKHTHTRAIPRKID
jgi:hypothetical protein